jgi:hypothetical protein
VAIAFEKIAATTFPSWLDTGVNGGPLAAASPAAWTAGLETLCKNFVEDETPVFDSDSDGR